MFRKEDLKFGDIITLRNGKEYMYVDEDLYSADGEYIGMHNYTENLKYYYCNNEQIDIMKVERYIKTQTLDKKYDLKTLYDRKEEILDEMEKQYLINLIKPFRSKVKYIQKRRFSKGSKFCWLNIGYTETTDRMSREVYEKDTYMSLPSFSENAMYTKMAEDYPYRPEQLGL